MGIYSLLDTSSSVRTGGTAYENLQKERAESARSRNSRARKQYLPPEQKSSMLYQLAQEAGGALGTVGKAIDTPGAIFRGVLAGKPLSGFTWNNRVSGEDLLETYGLIDENTNSYARTGAGFAAEVALDPLSMFFGAARALNIGGKAAKYTNLLDKAGDVAFAKLGRDTASRVAAARKTRTGRQALKQLATDKVPITPKNIAQRPLVGKRVAQTNTTLRELAEYGADANTLQKRIDDLNAYLRPRGKTYEQVADQTLGGAFGLGYFTPMATFNPRAAQGTLDALDAMGQAVRWSYPVRFGSSLFDKRVGGKVAAAEQIAAMRRFDDIASATSSAAGEAAGLMEKLRMVKLPEEAQKLLGTDSLLSPQGRNFVIRQVEGVGTASDELVRKAIGDDKFDSYVSDWLKLNDRQVKAGKSLGMPTNKYSDRYGVRYNPRYAIEADFGEYGRGASLSEYAASTLEQRGRQEYLKTPGGTSDLIEASQLPLVQKLVRQGDVTIEAAAKEVKDYLNAKHAPTRGGLPNPTRRVQGSFRPQIPERDAEGKIIREAIVDASGNPVLDKAGKPKTHIKMQTGTDVIDDRGAQKIVRFFAKIDPTTAPGTGVFEQHPLASQARNLLSQAGARAQARGIYESLAESARRLEPGQNVNSLAGSNKRLDLALNDIAAATGLRTTRNRASTSVVKRLKEELVRETGIDLEKIDLRKFAIDESVYNRLTAMKDFYSSPRAQQEMLQYLDSYTSLNKAFLLAFPSRHVRDMYSNAISVMLETNSPIAALKGFGTAKMILAGQFDKAEFALKDIERYKGLAGEALREKFVEDVATSGVLRTLATDDLLTANKDGKLTQFLPGADPVSWLGKDSVFSELVPGRGEFSGKASDFFQFRGVQLPGQKQAAYSTKNPLLNASEKISSYTDSVARLGGFIAMLERGANPEFAAKRITSALVDYSSLTDFERNVIRRFIFPWWAYNSRIGKYAVQSLVNSPGGGYAQMVRAMRVLQDSDDDTYIPEAMRQQFAVRVPEMLEPLLGIDPNSDTTTFFKDFDAPGVDMISLFDPQPTIQGTAQGTAQNLGLQMNPLLRTGIEYMTGQDMFSRRPLSEAVTPLDRIYKGVTGDTKNLNPLLKSAAQLTPFPRVAGIAGGLMDDRIPMQQRAIKQLFNTFTGVKMQTADPAWQLSDARRKAAQKLEGFMTNYTESYIPEERLPQVPPELMPYFQLYQSLGRDLREARQK